MKELHDLMSKKQAFMLFNLLCIASLALTGRLAFTPHSLLTSLIALLAMNGVAAISARNFRGWK
jgi:hypothetical protein